MTNVYSLQIYEIYREKRYGFFFFHRKKRKRRAQFRRVVLILEKQVCA